MLTKNHDSFKIKIYFACWSSWFDKKINIDKISFFLHCHQMTPWSSQSTWDTWGYAGWIESVNALPLESKIRKKKT